MVILWKIKKQQPKMMLYRILGNDLPPRHKIGQTYVNLNFILKNEPDLSNLRKKWIINRIVDARMEKKLIRLLEKYRQSYMRIPFVLNEYRTCGKAEIAHCASTRELKFPSLIATYNRIKYITNVNAARNLVLSDGKQWADWILPFDGNCCFTETGLRGVSDRLATEKSTKRCFAVPMYRLKQNKQYFNFTPKGYAEHEPQIIFGKDSNFKFDESYLYGFQTKVELLMRLKFKVKRTEHGIIVSDPGIRCGYVLRLCSGIKLKDEIMVNRTNLREKSFSVLLKKMDKYTSTIQRTCQ